MPSLLTGRSASATILIGRLYAGCRRRSADGLGLAGIAIAVPARRLAHGRAVGVLPARYSGGVVGAYPAADRLAADWQPQPGVWHLAADADPTRWRRPAKRNVYGRAPGERIPGTTGGPAAGAW